LKKLWKTIILVGAFAGITGCLTDIYSIFFPDSRINGFNKNYTYAHKIASIQKNRNELIMMISDLATLNIKLIRYLSII